MHWIDIAVIIVYALGMLSLGYFFKEQNDSTDYFLGGRSFGWFSMGLSTMATQLSAISFISAAAFVGLKTNGGMQWLTFELAVPLAMFFLLTVIVPPLYRSGEVSIYAFLERRFHASTRLLISIVFQISRAFATGIMIYTLALVLSAVIGIPSWQTILLSGILTIIYAYQGGMKAVVWGDVIQMFILFGGILVCTGYGLYELGGFDAFTNLMDRSRLQVVDYNDGFGENENFGLLPMIIGGFFLYISYYGCDQSQAQRALSGKDLGEVKRALLFNGLFRFPVTLAYCFMGLVLGTLALSPLGVELFAQIKVISQSYFAAELTNPEDYKADLLVPVFIANYLPVGIRGLLLVAILAAAMSSLSSAINSLSAASVEDFIVRRRKTPLAASQQLQYSRYLTVFWGIVCMLLAFFGGSIAKTVIEAINKIGSAFYGPIVATFLMAFFAKRMSPLAVNIGLLGGVALNLLIWIFELPIFWIWWNAIGFVVTVALAYSAERAFGDPQSSKAIDQTDPFDWSYFSILMAAFIAMLVFCFWLSTMT